jgi:predicted DNA-binding transcriptional regulator YafY
MSINKLALIRYKTIDNCLQNRFRKWTLDDLIEACSDALYEYEGITNGISKRAIQLDIQNMRSEKLGYNAPIIVVDRKFYTYEDRNYSITNIPLTQQDLGILNEVVAVLKQFKGFGYFNDLSTMITKLEDKVVTHQNKGISYIDMEKNDLLKGLEFIDPLLKSIQQRKVVELTYQSFKAIEPKLFIIHPYLLKEYRNRWFIFGVLHSKKQIFTFALDRIHKMKELPSIPFHEPTFNVHDHFKNAIGVTKSFQQREEKIIFRATPEAAPYIITKPIHDSQIVIDTNEHATTFQVNVVWNFELEKEILAFGEQVEVVGPRKIREVIVKRLNRTLDGYKRISRNKEE